MRLLSGILLMTMFLAPALADEDAFDRLVEEFEAHELEHNPIRAGEQGDLDAAGRWPDHSPETLAAKLEREAEFLERLEAISVDELDESDGITYALMEHLLTSRLSLAEFEPQRVSFTNDSGFFSQPFNLARSTRPSSIAEAEAWLRRLEALPDFLAERTAWLKRGIESDFVQPGLVAERVVEQLESLAAEDVEDHTLLLPLEALPSRVDAGERERVESAMRQAIEDKVAPAYRELLRFFREEYLAEPRESVGISAVPEGREYYRALVRHHTTLDTTPEEIHERGKEEVARIRAEMEEVIEQAGFEGSFEEFLHYLRTDPRFYAETERELLMHAAWIAKRADDEMPRFFRNLPRLPYGVRPVPESIAPNYTTGRYWSGNLEAGVAGGYMVNTYRLDQRPLYELPALTVHEGVPGHHHQIALAQELDDVPDFRRNSGITAFSEGWALYTEHLAIEMGIYETPYEDFGRLTYEMWRACRLVVDTGLHYFGWSQADAEACLLENSALSTHNVRTEVERYISWPGQALAYKTGELLIRELREQAEDELGEDFDLRDFHDHILSQGPMPLSALEQRMKDWIDKQSAKLEG
ncbi:DUF885 domain-containing protein [Wenzhouxiangella sp. AB-CW3]|uniref:DUF885 domain-containing protein n=1 Tax=Wenzhouxiangella sp. AB-CW3 TaxID=2771012 RepID=UPI00168A40E6|nr:DUF885 domain-containing protein [Wenzhouxiangella sp. AB-CW3]QOC21953.1 DUF885 domain-containing protein [Wenzhouxiangella sp. AB-CW3]